MNVVELKSKVPEGPICETPTYKRIMQILELSHHNGAMARILGAPGLGKTVALEQYADGCPYPDRAVIVTVSSSSGGSMLAFLNSCTRALGGIERTRANEAHDDVVSYLKRRNTLFMVDEAQKLNINNIELCREFHDATGCGVVLCGNTGTFSRFGNATTAKFGVMQIESRIQYRIELDTVPEEDVQAVCAHFKVRPKAAIKKLSRLAKQGLGLRMIVKVITEARSFADGDDVSAKHVEMAAKFMGVQI